ncbi:mCG1042067, partial [Mus musculus]
RLQECNNVLRVAVTLSLHLPDNEVQWSRLAHLPGLSHGDLDEAPRSQQSR